MKMSGRGEVFLADAAQDVHLVRLESDSMTVDAANLLAFDAGIDWDIERVKGVSGMLGGGLCNTRLEGTGWVAILSDDPHVLLDVAGAPTSADPQAAISSSGGVSRSIKTDVGLKDLIGRSSGEAVQMAFSGSGWVLVQPSEARRQPAPGQGEGRQGGLSGLLNG